MNWFQNFFKQPKEKGPTTSSGLLELEGIKDNSLQKKLKANETELRSIFKNSSDFSVLNIEFAGHVGLIVYIGSTIKEQKLSDKILRPITLLNKSKPTLQSKEDLEALQLKFFSGIKYQYCYYLHEVTWSILTGHAVILIDGIETALALLIDNIEYRQISEPSTQTIIRGPKDSFTESIETNISLIRRRIRNPYLKFEEYIIGKDSHTKVIISYLHGVVNEGILQELKKRIQKITITSIMDSSAIEETITDKSLTLFPLTFNTERPDIVSANISEGKIAIIVDGSPFVLLVPVVITDFFSSAEDYYQPFIMGSFLRVLRYVSFFIALLLPGLYVAITTYHHELFPTDLIISIQAQREGVPFPAVIEIFIMELTFEILREAGVRMPRAVGQTISIVGALVIGQAAVEAGLVSNVLVIVVALTAIASFVSPIYNFSIAARLLRFAFILAASGLGLYGIMLLLVLMVAHLASLRSFGVPYLAPVAPFIIEDQKDVFFRFPIWANNVRPSYLQTEAPTKTKTVNPPSPPKNKGGNPND